MVKTNDGRGYPAAVFLVEKEDQASIAEALKLIAHLNPDWNPKIIMVDKSDAEIGKSLSIMWSDVSVGHAPSSRVG